VRIIARILIHNWPLKALSVALATGLWLYVLVTTDPWTVREIDVPIIAQSPPADLQVMSISPATVKVTVAGRRRRVERLQTQLIRAVAVLKQPTTGEQEAAVRISVGSRPRGVEVLALGQTTVIVALDRRASQERAVQVSIRGRPAPGFEAVGQSCRPNQATVAGPESVVRTVTRAVAVVDISGVDSSRSLVSRIEARDARDMPVEGVRLSPSTADVEIRVARVNTRTVTITLGDLRLPRGVALASVDMEPQVITLTGNPAVLASLRSVRTEPVVFRPGETVTRAVVLLPRGVTAVSEDTVRVSIETESRRLPMPRPATRRGGATPSAGAPRGGTPTEPSASGEAGAPSEGEPEPTTETQPEKAPAPDESPPKASP
jgi:YbbR domain-containing protein